MGRPNAATPLILQSLRPPPCNRVSGSFGPFSDSQANAPAMSPPLAVPTQVACVIGTSASPSKTSTKVRPGLDQSIGLLFHPGVWSICPSDSRSRHMQLGYDTFAVWPRILEPWPERARGEFN